MKTRAMLLNEECTHREFYAQFVSDSVKSAILKRYSKKELSDALSKDEHLNSIPLIFWDSLHFTLDVPYRNSGDYYTKSTHVCIAKEAAMQIIESY